MNLLISFVITEYNVMKAHWEKYSVLASNGKVGTNKPIGRDVDLGGCLMWLDWNSKEEIRRIDLPCPSGFELLPEGIAVASMRKNSIYVLDKLFRPIKMISHPLFNDLHSVSKSSSGHVVTSTGVDGILEISPDGELVWSWFATRNGYEKDQLGNMRHIDLGADHRMIDYPTLTQSTHVNSAVEDPQAPRIFYASLFHQGEVIRIDRQRKVQTIVFAGLKNCHSIRVTNAGFIVSDTKGSRIVIFDKNFRFRQAIHVNSGWIADAFLSERGTYVVADADHCRILEIDELGRVVSEHSYEPNWKIYQVMELK